MKHLSMAALLCGALITGCGSDSDSTKSYADKVSAAGATLPYNVLRSDIDNGAKPGEKMEIRNGGYGSAATAHPKHVNRFYAMTDRGPNADITGGSAGAGKIFPVADYTPRIGLFELQSDGSVTKIEEILLKRPDGTPISGLPNPLGLGGTNETPYNVDGTPVTDATGAIKLDEYGLDSEGLVALKDGTFWVSDEYGPHIVHYSAEGKEIGRINPFAADVRNTYTLPAEFGKRWANRGMEGLAITPDEQTLVGMMQSTLDNPSKAVRGDLTRIVTVDLKTGTIKQYLYKQEIAQNANSEIVALSNDTFIVIERDTAFYAGGSKVAKPTAMKHVYKITLSSGTELEGIILASGMTQDAALGLMIDGKTLEEVAKEQGWETLAAKGITPVGKTLLVDMVEKVGYPHDKMEGLWVIDEHRLGVINDDDFCTWTTNNVIEQKYINAEKTRIDANVLYVIDNLDLSGK
ncbi:MAG: esterase-like activity of phytase family protein [Campylobacterales bacterium]|nr:esterase-like activity of phytase family protein [Campylobacterales bacterium]